MLTRRGFAGIGLATLAGRMLPEVAYAQRAALHGTLPNDMVWLNANENPDGPPASSIAAMTNVLPEVKSGGALPVPVRELFQLLVRLGARLPRE